MDFSMIKHLNVELTGWCNQNCEYCFNVSQRKNKLFSENIANWNNLLPILIKTGLQSIHLTGGEPFGIPNIIQLIESINKFGINVSVLSNGFRIAQYIRTHKKVLQNLSKAQISLDTLNEKKLTERRGSKYAKRDAINAIEGLREIGVKVEVSAVIDESILDDLDDLIAYCSNLNLPLLIRTIQTIGRNTQKYYCLPIDKEIFLKHYLDSKKNLKIINDSFFYLPDERWMGVFNGVRTIEYNGLISPMPIKLNGRNISSCSDLFLSTA